MRPDPTPITSPGCKHISCIQYNHGWLLPLSVVTGSSPSYRAEMFFKKKKTQTLFWTNISPYKKKKKQKKEPKQQQQKETALIKNWFWSRFFTLNDGNSGRHLGWLSTCSNSSWLAFFLQPPGSSVRHIKWLHLHCKLAFFPSFSAVHLCPIRLHQDSLHLMGNALFWIRYLFSIWRVSDSNGRGDRNKEERRSKCL